MSELDIDTRPPGGPPVEVTRRQLERLYVEQGLTTIEIADALDCHPSTVGGKLNRDRILTSGRNHGRSIPIDEERLRQLYLEEGETTYELAERFDCDPTVIERRLRWYGIEDRHTDAGDDPWVHETRRRVAATAREGARAGGLPVRTLCYQCERDGITDDEHREKYVEPTRGVGFGLGVHHRVSVRRFERWDLPIEDANRLSNLEVLGRSCHREFGDRVGTFDVTEG